MKIIQKITVRIAKIILWFVLCLLFMILSVYMLCPVYHFPETQPFSGNKIFNPYQEVSGNTGRNAIFMFIPGPGEALRPEAKIPAKRFLAFTINWATIIFPFPITCASTLTKVATAIIFPDMNMALEWVKITS